MKVLLTSGGTRTAIDSVRHIGNMSSGTFGNHICHAFLEAGHDVTFLYAKGSKCPHELRLRIALSGIALDDCGFNYEFAHAVEELLQQTNFMEKCISKYKDIPYDDFDDYAKKLEMLLGDYPDIVVLAAAVSDYAPVKHEGKISSELDEMTIHLVKTPKLIRKIKPVLPDCFLVGFKLLVDSTQNQLEAAMAVQMAKAECDMVVGNDLRDIKASKHTLTILSIDDLFYQFEPMPGAELAKLLVESIVMDKNTLDGKNKHLGA